MAIDLSRAPYFDDFQASDNYYKVLSRPAVAVQTREINQLQSILQDQIAKFGRNILKDGTIVEGCPFSIDNRYSFVKINDNYANGTAFTVSSFEGLYVQNVNGLLALIINTLPGFQSQDPNTNTLYIKYLNSVIAPNGAQQSEFSNSEQITLLTTSNIPVGNLTVLTPNTSNPDSVATGFGYAFSCGPGTIFKDNYFISVEPQTCIVEPYGNFPDGVVVGFLSQENIITPEANSQLNDNSVGSPNYAAPGAHRYQLIPELVVMQSNAVTNNTPFFPLASFQDGAPIILKNDTQYSIIGAEMARRTYETNGDFIVNPFLLTTTAKSVTDPEFTTNDNLVCSAGLGYVKGYRAQYLNEVTTDLPKATTFANVYGLATTASFGSYITINNYCGDFNTTALQTVEVHNVPHYAVTNNTFLATPYSISTKIGTLRMRGLSYNHGSIGTGTEEYLAYIFDANIAPGYSFSQATGLVLRNAGNTQTVAIADIHPTCSVFTSTVTIVTNTFTTLANTTNVIATYTNQSIPHFPALLSDPEGGGLPNGSIITVGGFTVDGQSTTHTYCYNPNNNTWTSLANYPVATGLGGVTLSGNVVYAGGGTGPTSGSNSLNNYYRYNPTNNTWTAIASAPIGVMNYGLATMANGSILQVGGQLSAIQPNPPTANCYRYDPGANTWTQVASLPTALGGQGCCPLANGSILSICGTNTGGPSWTLTQLVYRYDPGANTWTRVHDYPIPDCNMVAGLTGNGFIIGITGVANTNVNGIMTQNCYSYDPVGNAWFQAASYHYPLAENGCAPLANGCIISFGGQVSFPSTNTSLVSNVYMYDWGQNIWTQNMNVATFTTISNVVSTTTTINTPYYTNTTVNTTFITEASFDKLIFPFGQKALKLDGFNNQSFVYRSSINATFSNTASGSMYLTLTAPAGTGVENFDTGGLLTGQAVDTFIILPTQSGFSTNKTGTVNATANSATLLGNGTTFLTDYTAGDYIYINNTTAQINSIVSNIQLTLNQPFSGITSLVNTHAKTFPAGVPVPFDNTGSRGGNRSITVSGNTATVSLGEATAAPFNATVYFDVLRSFTVPIKKNYKSHVYVAINCASHPNGTNGPFSLGFVDVANINAIYVSTSGFSNTTPDFSPVFVFDDGQRDGAYELASITPRSNFLTPNASILVDLNVYTYDQSQGVGYFTCNSYPVDDSNPANTSAIQTQFIPQYVSDDGHLFDLRDCVDFRPFANNTANSQANSINWASVASVNPSSTLTFSAGHCPSPDTNYITDLQYYLPRIDKAILSTGAVLGVIRGVPSLRPIPPLDSLTAMTLGVIHVPPYPSLSTPDAKAAGRYDYAVTIDLTQNQRYTMQDIGLLADRVEQLEYYSSLSILEDQAQKAFPTTIFQNGFVVDPFTGFNIADTLDPTFNCCIDTSSGIMRPALSVFTKAMWNNGTIPLNENIIGICGCDQAQASDITPCTQQPYNYCYGRIEFQPILLCSPDFFQDPDVITNLANNANWVNISAEPATTSSSDWRNPYGTEWRHWRHYAANGVTTSNNIATVTDIYGNVLQQYQSSVTSSNNKSVIVNNIPGYKVENIQIDTEVIDYTRYRDIDFIARGLKANTTIRAFIGTYDVTNCIRQCQKGFAEETFGNYGANVTTDATGCVFGRLSLPAGIFKEGSMQVTMIDNVNKITTRADGYLQTVFTDWTNWRDVDCTDQVANYEAHAGVTTQYLPNSTIINIANTTFLNQRKQGNIDILTWNTYYASINNATWQRFPSQAYTPSISDDWNPTYLAQNGFRSFDRGGADISQITYGLVPSTKNR